MNERIIPEPSEQKSPGKIVPLPVTAPIPVTAPVKGKPSNLKRNWLIAAMASLLVVAIAATTWWAVAENNTIHYVSMPIAKGAVTRTVTATGTVNPELTIIVGAAVSGIIKELNCDYNTRVKKGQICARIDPRPYQSIVDRKQGESGGRKGAARKGQGEPYLRKACLRACRHPRADACRLPGRL